MRKMTKKKLRSCPLCKPSKTKGCNRWKIKELIQLKDDDKACRNAVGKKESEKNE